MHYTRSDGSATFSVKVTKLRATGASCESARQVAADVAKRDLASGKLPKASRGYTVRDVTNCTACSPQTLVVAASGKRKVTFTLVGGA